MIIYHLYYENKRSITFTEEMAIVFNFLMTQTFTNDLFKFFVEKFLSLIFFIKKEHQLFYVNFMINVEDQRLKVVQRFHLRQTIEILFN